MTQTRRQRSIYAALSGMAKKRTEENSGESDSELSSLTSVTVGRRSGSAPLPTTLSISRSPTPPWRSSSTEAVLTRVFEDENLSTDWEYASSSGHLPWEKISEHLAGESADNIITVLRELMSTGLIGVPQSEGDFESLNKILEKFDIPGNRRIEDTKLFTWKSVEFLRETFEQKDVLSYLRMLMRAGLLPPPKSSDDFKRLKDIIEAHAIFKGKSQEGSALLTWKQLGRLEGLDDAEVVDHLQWLLKTGLLATPQSSSVMMSLIDIYEARSLSLNTKTQNGLNLLSWRYLGLLPKVKDSDVVVHLQWLMKAGLLATPQPGDDINVLKEIYEEHSLVLARRSRDGLALLSWEHLGLLPKVKDSDVVVHLQWLIKEGLLATPQPGSDIDALKMIYEAHSLPLTTKTKDGHTLLSWKNLRKLTNVDDNDVLDYLRWLMKVGLLGIPITNVDFDDLDDICKIHNISLEVEIGKGRPLISWEWLGVLPEINDNRVVVYLAMLIESNFIAVPQTHEEITCLKNIYKACSLPFDAKAIDGKTLLSWRSLGLLPNLDKGNVVQYLKWLVKVGLITKPTTEERKEYIAAICDKHSIKFEEAIHELEHKGNVFTAESDELPESGDNLSTTDEEDGQDALENGPATQELFELEDCPAVPVAVQVGVASSSLRSNSIYIDRRSQREVSNSSSGSEPSTPEGRTIIARS